MKSLALILSLMVIPFLGACAPSESDEAAKLNVANKMVQAWNEKDWDGVIDLFAEDGVFQSVMLEPMKGRETIRARWSPMFAGIETIELQVRNIGVIGDVVVIERVDDFVYKGKHGSVPVVAVLEIADSKVQEWREYYDHASLVAAMTPDPLPEAKVLAAAEIEILALTEKLQVDWNGGDMSAYLDAYWNDPGLSLMFGGTAVRGWQALSDLFTSSWTTEEQMGDFVVGDVAVRFAGPDIGIVSGGFEHQFTTEKIVGTFTHVWRRFDDGRWLIVHEHTSRAPTN